MNKLSTFFKIYTVTITILSVFLILTSFSTKNPSENFKEITVERINIVEPNGDLKMVISNSARQHPGMFDGEVIMERQRPPGVIFFNEEKDEVGGLVYSGNKKDGAGMVLSVDQYKNDQVLQMQYLRNPNGQQRYGLNVWDRSEKMTLPRFFKVLDSLKRSGIEDYKTINKIMEQINDGNPISAQRLFAGKSFDENVGMFIKDEFGNNRIKIYVDKFNVPKFEILNEDGSIIKSLINK